MKPEESLLYSLALRHNAVLMTDALGTIQFVNEQFCNMTGFYRHELIGKNPRVLNSGFHSKEFFQTLYQTVLAGNSWSGEIRNRRKNQEIYWVRVTILPQLDQNQNLVGLLAIQTETTSQIRAETTVNQLKHRLDTLVEQAPVGVLEFSSDLHLIHNNPSAQSMLGLKETNKSIWERIIYPKDLCQSLNQCLNTQNPAQFRVTIRNTEIEELHWWVQPIPGTCFDEPGILVVMDNITQKNELIRRILAIAEDKELVLGQELHDTLGQNLAGLCLKFSKLTQNLQSKESDDLAEMKLFEAKLRESMHLVRNLAREHCAYHILDGLGSAISLMLQEAQKLRYLQTEKCNLSILDGLKHEIWLPVYRILREAVFNVIFHSKADRICITVSEDSSHYLCIMICDNGIGMVSEPKQENLGLKIAGYRADLIGAQICYGNLPEGGFFFELKVPWDKHK
ncbi:MAG: PAS domain-containing protein [Candidatus Cloacimonetes bacterium]|nr:PAS domain-containing protein [Candidatus Cloacimonadota bacterium]